MLDDLENDPGESYDTADQNPQIVADILRRVYQMLSGFPQPVQAAWNTTVKQRVEGTWPGELPILLT